MSKKTAAVVHQTCSLFHKGGTTDAIKEYNRLVDQIEAINKVIHEEYEEASKGLDERYRIVPHVHISDEGTELLSFVGVLTNSEQFDALLETYGQRGSCDESFSSVRYYRVNQVLCQEGGGLCLLKEHSICTDEEWESMKEGKIPEHLLDWMALEPENVLMLENIIKGS